MYKYILIFLLLFVMTVSATDTLNTEALNAEALNAGALNTEALLVIPLCYNNIEIKSTSTKYDFNHLNIKDCTLKNRTIINDIYVQEWTCECIDNTFSIIPINNRRLNNNFNFIITYLIEDIDKPDTDNVLENILYDNAIRTIRKSNINFKASPLYSLQNMVLTSETKNVMMGGVLLTIFIIIVIGFIIKKYYFEAWFSNNDNNDILNYNMKEENFDDVDKDILDELNKIK